MDDLDARVRRRVKAELEKKAWKHTTLAARAGIHPGTMQKLMTGPAGWRLDYLQRVATALELDPVALLRDGEVPPEIRPDIIELWHAMSRLSHADVVALVAMANGMTRRRPLDTAVDVRYKDGQK